MIKAIKRLLENKRKFKRRGLMQKTACISGCCGQDGSYLAELLLDKGYLVVGIDRRKSVDSAASNFRIKDIVDNENFILLKGDITDATFISRLISKYKPDEFYNLAAMSFVKESFNTPAATLDIDAKAVVYELEAIRNFSPKTKFYQASSSELYGDNPYTPYNEESKFMPRSPYGIAKASAHYFVKVYREAYGIFACAGILMNHESPRRGEEFVTKKIAMGVARISKGLQKEIVLGNLEAKRDWGYSPIYCEGMWLMLQQEKADDYVLATGEAHSIREFLDKAFKHVGISDWKPYVKTSEKHLRPAEVQCLVGDASKAKKMLGWESTVKFEKLVEIMVNYELEKLQNN